METEYKMLMMIESAMTVRLIAGSFGSSSGRLSQSCSFRNKFKWLRESCCRKRSSCVRKRVEACAEEQVGSFKRNAEEDRDYSSKDVEEAELIEVGEARLSPEETSRTIVEVNSKAVLMFSGLLSDEVHQDIFLPDMPYVTGENGNIYFHVKNDEDILQNLIDEDTLVQVIIGLDTKQMLSEIESLSQLDIDFGNADINDDSSDDEDDVDENEEDWIEILDDEDSDESPGDWAKLDTMRVSHPMYFAKKLADFVGDDPIDCMDQPPAGLAIQGILRPSFLEEHSSIHKNKSDCESSNNESNQIGKVAEDKQEESGIINGHGHSLNPSQDKSNWPGEVEKGESLENGTSFYKLEMIKIQLISAHEQQTFIEVDDFRRALPGLPQFKHHPLL